MLFKQQLFDQMKQSGILDSLKSNLRARLYEQLDLKNERKPIDLDATKAIRNRHTYRIAVSLIADLMQKCDMPYAKSVFLPECGMSQGALNKMEMVEHLGLQHDDHIKAMGDTTPLLLDILDQVKQSGSVRPNLVTSYCQTEDVGGEGLSLDQKLRNIDYGLMDRV